MFAIAQLVKGRLSDEGGLRFESQAGRVKGKSIPSLWRDEHPAMKGRRPPEHCTGHFVWTNRLLRKCAITGEVNALVVLPPSLLIP